MRNASQPIHNTDDYIALAPVEFRGTLEQMRSLIKKAAPAAEETISYQIPCFKDKYMLVGIGINKKYCSFYTMSPGLVKKLKSELAGVTLSGATLHFLPGEKLPVALLQKIVKARMKENAERSTNSKF